jgi:ribosomal protein S18 acetylase RimI-like enzyme
LAHRIRQLVPADLEPVNRFLEARARSSMFLMSNLARTGLDPDHGKPFQATYAGAFHDERLVGMVAFCWNGMILVQAPSAVGPLVVALLDLVDRPLSGFVGPYAQVRDAVEALGLTSRRTTSNNLETLYALRLTELRIPSARPGLQVRKAMTSDVPVLASWSAEFQIESLGTRPGPDLEEKCLEVALSGVERGHIWVARAGTQLVSMSAFNATLADRVQLGGVYTPPDLRSRGYSRRVIAESLLAVRSEGVREAILFTDVDNVAAQTCYESLGFEAVGKYALVQFDPSFP